MSLRNVGFVIYLKLKERTDEVLIKSSDNVNEKKNIYTPGGSHLEGFLL